MRIQLEQLINQALEELKRIGLKEATIKFYRHGAYNHIRNFCVEHGTTSYEPATLDAFLSSQKKRLDSNEICKRDYRKLRRAVLMLKDLSQHATLQWGHYCNRTTSKIDEISGGNMRAYKNGQQIEPLELERLLLES